MAVDDECDITTTLKVGLENDGQFEVYLFNNAESALRSFKPNFYVLVLMILGCHIWMVLNYTPS
jgi:DNA-binding NtrC family response regulator